MAGAVEMSMAEQKANLVALMKARVPVAHFKALSAKTSTMTLQKASMWSPDELRTWPNHPAVTAALCHVIRIPKKSWMWFYRRMWPCTTTAKMIHL
jgi:hypothetical protein